MHLTFFVTCLIPSTYYVYTAAAEAFYASFFPKHITFYPLLQGSMTVCVSMNLPGHVYFTSFYFFPKLLKMKVLNGILNIVC